MTPKHRSNGAGVVEALERALEVLDLGGRRVLVAVSGGVDSVVLAHALCGLAPRAHIEVCVGHVNHGLRGAASDADERFVAELAAALGVPCSSRRVDPLALRAGRSSLERPTLQEAARTLRYAALDALADSLEASRVATAHHADDQVETVLLRLLRGSGPDGLGGIPERSPDRRLVRPLLEVSRAQIERYARTHALAWREDASNARGDYARNRLRRDWIPGLTAHFNPRLLRAIANLAEAQRRDSEWIQSLVSREAASRFSIEGAWLRIEAKDWSALPEALARRLAREALARCGAGRHASRVHLGRMLEFLRNASNGKRIELPGGLTLTRERGGFRLGPLRGCIPVGTEGAC
ncbi:MAG: tRNA lysidine(34) synthetase TilS [Myxococcales bacterium]|nr:tRNA lysidine(34) synthetase TilS [Myxococcales bacterium]MDH5306899.1 tRNA lysidine(34) synthetase TilS [Myxococcales bacterium]MDH5566292.1 tRNA lysidine(34) synthetase TilS [Myxococcales bacterium]